MEVITEKDIEVVIDNVGEVSTDSALEVDVIDNTELAVSVNRKEFNIVGDELYIPKRYEDAPQWLRDLIGTVTEQSYAQKITDLNNLSTSLQQLIVELEVAKNTYTQSIISSNDINERINTAITTLNSSLSSSDATIVDLISTKATPEEASAIALNTISSSINNGEIGALIGSISNTLATETEALANNIDLIHAEMSNGFEGTADAIRVTQVYVGIDENGGSTGTGLLADVSILQKQNDGIIETVTGTYDVMINPQDPNLAELVLTAEPYASWKAQDVSGIDTRLAHIGDVYIKYGITSNGAREYVASFKFIRTIVDASDAHKSTDADGFTWALIIDQAAQDAYNQALNAYDLADNKRRVFVGLGNTTTPSVPYDQGDLWLIDTERTVNGYQCKVGDMLRCIETKGSIGTYEQNDWVLASSYANAVDAQNQLFQNFVNNDYATFVSNIQSQVDGKAETFYQSSVPTGRIKALNVPDNVVLNKYIGDLWKNTYVGTVSGYLGNNTEYIYTKKANGANWDYNWTKMEVPDIVFDTIDTKKSIYSGDSVPVAVAPDVIEVNDMWITGSNVVGYDKESIYVWNGSAWIKPLKYTDDSATVALQTGLANGTVTVKLTNAYVGTTPFLTYLNNEIDSKVGVYSGETAPVAGQPNGVATNDIYLWFTTASKALANGTTQVYDITRTYKYSGSAWNEITTDSNITALADLADGKRTVFSGNTVPVGAVARDIWIPSATNGIYLKGEIYQYNGTSWIVATKYSADLEAVRNNLQSQVDGKVDTYYQGTVPTGMTALNNGDYWYCTADVSTYKKGKVYKYVHATTLWVETADVSRYAFDVADGKAAIFTSTNAPTSGYKINDMLIVIGSFNNGTTTFSDGVVLSSNSNRVSGFTPSDWVKKINDTEDLDAFVNNTYTPAVTSLQNQVDGKVESWFKNSTSDPKTAWTDAATRSKHDGDLWYQLDTKRSYWYGSSTNSWNLIDDEKAIKALADAATAQTAANNAQTSANTANSLLADIASDNKLVPSEKVSVKKEWDIIQGEYTKNLAQADVYSVSTSSYTSAYNSLNGYITPLLSSLTTTSDIVGSTFRSMFKAYYDANVDLLNAVANKINAIADGKITSYYIDTFSSLQSLSNGWTTAEKTSNVGDLATVWNDSTLDKNGTWRWNGTTWVSARDKKLVALASDVTNLSTELTNGTNTWSSADSTLENSLRTEISDESSRVESKFAYNSNVSINGVWKKSGFGLTTNYISGNGTQANPYVSEFWIDASRLKFTNSNQTGQVAPFTIDATGVTPKVTFNGEVSFTNVSDTQGSGTNLLYNSAPKIGNETKGWSIGWSNHGLPSSISGGFDIWRPTGGASVYIVVPGSPGVGTVFDINNSRFPVIASTRYEASAYLSSHRCDSWVTLAWFDINGNYISENGGTSNSDAPSGPLTGWSRSTMFATAPSNAATAQFYVRSAVTGNDPHCFVAYAYAGIASTNQTIPSNWSEGSSAGVSSGDVVNEINNGLTTTINGGRITTGSITANQIQANSVSADRLLAGTNATTVWTGGGLVSSNFNGNPYGNIGAPTQGFRLSSGAAGTEADPNIYGAYIKGSTVDIETLSVKALGYAGNSGRVVRYQRNGYIYMPGYGSGFLASRVCSQAESAVKVEGWYRAATNYLVAYLQYSTDGINWFNLAVKDAQQYGYQEYFYIYFAELFNPNLVTATAQVTFRIIGSVGGDASDILISIYNN